MKRLLFAAVAAVALTAAAPASAQVYFGVDPWGAGVRVGPLGFGVGPRHGPYWRDGYYAYGADCRAIRQKIVTRSGRVIFKTDRVCD